MMSSPSHSHPLILALDQQGVPHRWISWQSACVYYARNQVAWSAGDQCFTVMGGWRQDTGERSLIVASSIIAIKGRPLGQRAFSAIPPLSNRELFRRDQHLCAYCGQRLSHFQLTRDHIIPVSQGGLDIWMNVTTACRTCNQRKSGRTPEQAGMHLLYAPYVPNKAEFLILSNRRILIDQMDFLARHVPAYSRCLSD